MAFDTYFTTGMPQGFKLPAKLQKLKTAKEEANQKYRDYLRANDKYAAKSRTGVSGAHTVTPALAQAEKELQEVEIQAVAAGNPLPDKDKHMAAVRKQVAECERMSRALRMLADKAADDFWSAVRNDLLTLAESAAKESDAAKDEYQAAVAKAEAAHAKLCASIDRFCWAVSSGDVNRPSGRGYGEPGQDADWWQRDENGRLTVHSADALGLSRFGLFALEEYEPRAEDE